MVELNKGDLALALVMMFLMGAGWIAILFRVIQMPTKAKGELIRAPRERRPTREPRPTVVRRAFELKQIIVIPTRKRFESWGAE